MVWSDDETRLNDIFAYFNIRNKKWAYLTSWIRNIMAFWEAWEFYRRPPKEKEYAKEKNPKWEVNMVWVDWPKILLFYNLGRSTQIPILFCWLNLSTQIDGGIIIHDVSSKKMNK